MKRLKVGRVIPNGVDERIFDWGSQRPEHPGGNGEFNIYSILEGFGVRKNATAAIAAFSIVKRQLPKATFHLVGSGYESDGPAHRWATKNGLDEGCLFRGFVEQTRLFQEICGNAHLLLHPSIEESFSMAILEAAALGVPVVASKNAGGPSYILDGGRLGCLVDTTSASEIANGVLRLSRFPLEARARASKCWDNAKMKFTLTSMTQQYINFYSDILDHLHL